MKKRRKTEHCLNCGYQLDPSFDYCPKCGQENTNNQISFGHLISDFFSNYFSLDSRFGRSVVPFFFKPGTLTSEFMDGKRVRYANPIRLYLVVSLIHFFIMNIYLDTIADYGKFYNPTGDEQLMLDSLQLSLEQDSLIQATIAPFDSLIAEASPTSIDVQTDSSGWFDKWNSDLKTIRKMSDERYGIQEIEDSIHNEEKPYLLQKINRQTIKILNSDKHTLNMFIVKNIPILMFILLPLYALILKMYFRRKLYINHVVHGLHLHSFVFIMLSIYWTVRLFSETTAHLVDLYLFLVVCLYIVLSFRNTYHITYIRSIFKVLGTGFVYTFLLNFGMLFEIIISLFFY